MKKEYLLINKRTKVNYLITTDDLRTWMINHLDLSDDYIIREMEQKNIYEVSSITPSHKVILRIEASNQSEAFAIFALKNKLYLEPEYAIVIRYVGKTQLDAQG